MNKEKLLNSELYFIKSNLTEAPHLVNSEFFVLFTSKTLALDFAQRITRRLKFHFSVGDSPVSTCVITDNNKFFQEMMSIGFSKFSFNGEGPLFDLNSIYGNANKPSLKEKEVYINYMGYIKMQKSSHIGSVKTMKINNAKQYLSSGNNPIIMQRFIESQKRLQLYYKYISITDIPLYDEQIKSDISVVESDIVVQQNKNNRPIVAGIMFFLSLFFILAFIGAIGDGDFPATISFGVGAIGYCVLGIAMKKRHLKRFGWAIISLMFIMSAIDVLLRGEESLILITQLVIAAILGGLFAFANRNNRVG